MRPVTILLALVSLVLVTACSTPESRIADNHAAFDKFPPDVQQKIRTGQVEVGFTHEMVQLAMGEPTRKYFRKTEMGDNEVWSYRDNSPTFSFGVGVASSSGGHGSGQAVGTGVGMSTGGYDPEEKARVEFIDGRVVAVEIMRK